MDHAKLLNKVDHTLLAQGQHGRKFVRFVTMLSVLRQHPYVFRRLM